MARIVVVDDLPEMRMMFEDLLTSWGHDVMVFEDGAPALAEVDFLAVDMVITDLEMPTPGQQVIQEVRARGYEVPIVVVSAHVHGCQTDVLQAMGAQAVLAKPPDFRLLKKIISELLNCPRSV